MKRFMKTFLGTLAIFTVLCTGVFGQDKGMAKTGDTAEKATKMRSEFQPATIEKAQQALKTKGFYKGEVTGKLDATTKDAVKAFQTKEGITPTGRLNKDTRQKLGIESEDAGAKSTKSPSKKRSKK